MTITCDGFWGGRLRIWQPARGAGYRFNLDPVLLAGFAPAGRHVLDLGSGCGILSLLLLVSGKAERATAVEVQEELAELAWRNARENGLQDRMEVQLGDLRQLSLAQVDRVVFNPPYFRAGEGRGAESRGRDAARHERHGTLADFVASSRRHLQHGGHVSAIVRATRAAELETLLRQEGAVALRRREVMARAADPPRHVLLQATYGARLTMDMPLVREPALIVHLDQGQSFGPEVTTWLQGSL